MSVHQHRCKSCEFALQHLLWMIRADGNVCVLLGAQSITVVALGFGCTRLCVTTHLGWRLRFQK